MSLHAHDKLGAAMVAAGMSPANDTHLHARPVRLWNRVTDDRPPRDPDPLPPTWSPGPHAKLLLDLEPHDCRFPVGDDTGVDQLFCGDDAHHSATGYCPTCAQRVLTKGATPNPKVLH